MDSVDRKPLVREEEIYALLHKILQKKKTVILWTILFAILGLVVAITNKKEYTAVVSMAPESGQSSSFGSLGSLASMAGIDLGGLNGGEDAIYPYLYPDIVQSMPFVTSLLDIRVQTIDNRVDSTYLYYRQNFQKKSLVSRIVHAPKRLVKNLMSMMTPKLPWDGQDDVFDPYHLSEKQLNFIEAMQGDISISVDKKTDVITLSFVSQDPKVSAIMVDNMRELLQQRITDYRTNKAQQDFSYFESLYKDSKKEYESAQMRYAEFCDRNRNVTSEKALVEKDRLEADMDMKNTLYSQWAQQVELAKAKIQQTTPAYTVLVPASIPALPSSPRKLVVLFLFCVLGGFCGVSAVVLKDPVTNVLRKIFCYSE